MEEMSEDDTQGQRECCGVLGEELQSTWTQNNDAKTRFIPSEASATDGTMSVQLLLCIKLVCK